MLDPTKNYWLTLEPYTYVNFTKRTVLLYNTLDGITIEVIQPVIIDLLSEIYDKKNCGVVLLPGIKITKEIRRFIVELRNKFMGNIIDVSLSKRKPVQLLPILNLQRDVKRLKQEPHRSIGEDIMSYLRKIDICIGNSNQKYSIFMFSEFLSQIPNLIPFTLYINKSNSQIPINQLIQILIKYPITLIIDWLNSQSIIEILSLVPQQENFKIKIIVNFPYIKDNWQKVWEILSERENPFEIVFKVISNADCEQAEQIINQHNIENFQFEPVYTGNNLQFFKENVFLSKEDILANPLSMREIFAHQSLNTFDFGKITIIPNGDVHGNIHYPPLGNISTHTIQELLYKELDEGKSWLRIRNQAPCTDCLYQWLCPSPSNYEIAIGQPNLCHVLENE